MSLPRVRLNKGYGVAVIADLLLNGPTLALAETPTFTAKADSPYLAGSDTS